MRSLSHTRLRSILKIWPSSSGLFVLLQLTHTHTHTLTHTHTHAPPSPSRYLPLIGLCILVAHSLDARGGEPGASGNGDDHKGKGKGEGKKPASVSIAPIDRGVVVATLAVLLLAFAGRSYSRHADWRTQSSLLLAGNKTNPFNPKWSMMTGNALYARKKYAEAAGMYEEMRVLDPRGSVPYDQLGIVHMDMQKTKEAEVRLSVSVCPTNVSTFRLNYFQIPIGTN